MKVEDKRRPEREQAQHRQKDQIKNKAEGEKSRFSQMMECRKAPGGHRRGDERGRELREGLVQSDGREADARRLTRLAPKGGQSSQKGQAAEAKQEVLPGIANKEGHDNGGAALKEKGGLSSSAQSSDVAAFGAPIEELQERSAGAQAMSNTDAPRAAEPPVTQVAREIVEAVYVGQDSQQRQVIFVDVTVPGRGDVRIRLRRDGGGMEVRMRADNDALARTLQQGVRELREEGQKKDIEFTSIRVVR